MTKLKTLCSAKKRFKKTATGKFKRQHANHRHILTKKNSSYKRFLRSKTLISKADLASIKRFFPYS